MINISIRVSVSTSNRYCVESKIWSHPSLFNSHWAQCSYTSGKNLQPPYKPSFTPGAQTRDTLLFTKHHASLWSFSFYIIFLFVCWSRLAGCSQGISLQKLSRDERVVSFYRKDRWFNPLG